MATATAQIMSEFQKKPTYNELIQMITDEELKMKPSIEDVIPFKATLYRNNQYGSRFDNNDITGLRQQEELRSLKMAQQQKMREGMFHNPDRTRFDRNDGFRTPQENILDNRDDQELFRIRMENFMRVEEMRRQGLLGRDRGMVDDMLSAVSHQDLPQGVEMFMTPSVQSVMSSPELIPATPFGSPPTMQDEAREMARGVAQNFLDSAYRSASEKIGLEQQQQQPTSPSQEQAPEPVSSVGEIIEMAKSEIIYDDRPAVLNNLTEYDLKFQLYLRGLDVDDPEYELENLKKKGREKNKLTKKEYYRSLVDNQIKDGTWNVARNDRLLEKRTREFKNKSKGTGSSGSSLVSKAKKGLGFIAKEGAKELISGAVESQTGLPRDVVRGGLGSLF